MAACRVLVVLAAAFAAVPRTAPAQEAPEASAVLRFTVPKLVDGRFDLEVILFHRAGAFHNGYARVSGRDSLPHSVDVTPSRPIQWQTADGKPVEVPDKMRGYYSYTDKPVFAAWKKRYEDGEIRVGYPIPTPPIAWDGRRLTGTVDVLVKPPDRANTPGRDGADVPYRIRVDASGREDGTLAGAYTLWTYGVKDDDYGEENPKTKGELAEARWDAAYWRPAPGTEYAAGRDWPQARGPDLTGAAADCESPLLDNLHDARLLWVSEEILPGGRGAVLSRGGFAMYPYAWQNIGFGGFAGPVVAGGRVYQVLSVADEALVAGDEAIRNNVYVQLGADARTLGNERGHMRDSVLCLDARTGRTLWWWKSEKTFGKVPDGKGGVGTTACVAGGRVYARGSGGLYGLEADRGKLLWHSAGAKAGDRKVNYGLSGGWSHDMSPVLIGGVLVMTHSGDGSLAGVNPADGALLWSRSRAGGFNAVPTKVVLDGRERILVASGETQQLSLIEPADGRILWTSDVLGANATSLCVSNDVVCGNGVDVPADLKKEDPKTPRFAAGARVGVQGAGRLWQSDQAGYPPGRSVPVAHRGHFYIDTREGFWCLEAESGKIVNSHPHIYKMTGGSHNWVWTIAGNDRLFTSGLLMFSLGQDGFERLPGRLSLPLADGYTCPIKPALADGRLFARLGDKMVCYDLRRVPRRKSQTIELKAHDAYASSVEADNPVLLRVRAIDGRLARVYTNWPEVVGGEAASVNAWVAGYRRLLPWPSYPAEGLTWTDARLTGNVRLLVGWHFEDWAFDLRRQGPAFAGRFERSFPALESPLKVSGKVAGRAVPADGGTLYVMTLAEAASQGARNEAMRTVTAAVVRTARGRRAWATGLNAVAHEADPSGLEIAPEAITGRLTVLFRDDEYFHLNAREGTGVAATYEISAALSGDTLEGTHTGTFGHAWRRAGKMTGELR